LKVALSHADEVSFQHSLWADSSSDAHGIWLQFLSILNTVDNPALLHYGSFERDFFRKMQKRFGLPPEFAGLKESLTNTENVLTWIYGRIYFPTYSNGLKEIAGYLKLNWTDPTASGEKSIFVREEWERSRCSDQKNWLLTYNAEDCSALATLVGFLSQLSTGREQDLQGDVVNTDKLPRPQRGKFHLNTFQLKDLKLINKAAYWDYDLSIDLFSPRRPKPQHLSSIILGRAPNDTFTLFAECR
jgi:hypothetical protein